MRGLQFKLCPKYLDPRCIKEVDWEGVINVDLRDVRGRRCWCCTTVGICCGKAEHVFMFTPSRVRTGSQEG